MGEVGQNRGCCGSSELPIVVPGPSWRRILVRTRKSAPNFLGQGATSPPAQDPSSPGETGRKLKLLQVCPKNLCQLRGSPHKLGTNREQIGNKLPKNTSEIGRSRCT